MYLEGYVIETINELVLLFKGDCFTETIDDDAECTVGREEGGFPLIREEFDRVLQLFVVVSFSPELVNSLHKYA